MASVTLWGVHDVGPESFPCALLRVDSSQHFLVAWLGWEAAEALSRHANGLSTSRPDTHEILCEALELAGGVESVEIVAQREGVFMADVLTRQGTVLDCRLSDALVIAELTDTPVDVADEVLSAAVFISPDSMHEYFGVEGPEADEGKQTISMDADERAKNLEFAQFMNSLGVSEADFFPGAHEVVDGSESGVDDANVTRDEDGEK